MSTAEPLDANRVAANPVAGNPFDAKMADVVSFARPDHPRQRSDVHRRAP